MTNPDSLAVQDHESDRWDIADVPSGGILVVVVVGIVQTKTLDHLGRKLRLIGHGLERVHIRALNIALILSS